MGLACALAWLALRQDIRPLRVQSILLIAFAFLRVLAVNLPREGSYHLGGYAWSARMVSTALVVALCYQASRWHRRAATFWLKWSERGLTWAASTMVTLLFWYELHSASVALGWGAFALVMLEVGIWEGSANLRIQAYVAVICSFLRLLFVNLNATSSERMGLMLNDPRIYTVIPLAVLFFYFYQRLDEQLDHLSEWEKRLKAAWTFAWLGTFMVVLLLRFEVPLDWIAAAWSATTFTLVALAWKTQKRVFLHQALLLSLGVLFRGVLHNLYERSYFTAPSKLVSSACLMAAVAFLFTSLIFAFKLRRKPIGEERPWLARVGNLLDAHPEQVLFFVPLVLLTAFLAVELRSGMVTVGWALEAVVVFLAALRIGERSYRLSALGLLLLCVGKIVVVDIWRLGIRDRAITFIVLGALLLAVSILYTKNREKVKEFL